MKTFSLLAFLYSIQIHATVTIAFLEVKDPRGYIVQLEPSGKYAHIAISFQDKWLHSHPLRGVEIVDQVELEKIGKIAEVISIETLRELTRLDVIPYLGKPYDSEFSWSDDKIYCAELVAKILKIPPTPMTFSSPVWSQEYKRLRGEMGLSPDDIYKSMISAGYLPKSASRSCKDFFTN